MHRGVCCEGPLSKSAAPRFLQRTASAEFFCRTLSAASTAPAELFEKYLGLLEIGGVEALCEPAVDFGEDLARLVSPALFREQPSEAHGRAQLR